MKYIVVLGDGMADEPIKELGDKTPLMVADTPQLDDLARKSIIGMAHTIPGHEARSDTANYHIRIH